jgi:lipid-binding SYLF domain-containing protein
MAEIDLVLLVMNRDGAERLLNNKVSLGVDASFAGGPVGRAANAATDAQLTAEILSYSRACGVLAGVDISGGALSPDDSARSQAATPRAEPPCGGGDESTGTFHIRGAPRTDCC